MALRKDLNASSRPARFGSAHRIRTGNLEPGNLEPMTVSQAATLKALSAEACEPDAFDEHLGATEASLRINALRAKLQHERRNQ